jgi:hypothetical protein
MTGLCLTAALTATLPTGAAGSTAAEDPPPAFTLTDPRINESSGLTPSALHPGVFWTHNDSGAGPEVYAIGPDGKTLATITLPGVDTTDWEGIATGRDAQGKPALYVGNTGNNLKNRTDVQIIRFTEPAELKDQSLTAETFPVRFSDGPFDCEAILVDPRDNSVYLASKLWDKEGQLYKQSAPLRTDQVTVFNPVGPAPQTVTDGAFSPDGSRFVLRTYPGGTLYSAPGQAVGPIVYPQQKQGESITFTPDGQSLLLGSEGLDSPVIRIPLTGAQLPPKPAPTPSAKPFQLPSEKDGNFSPSRITAYILLTLVLSAIIFSGIRRGRRNTADAADSNE